MSAGAERSWAIRARKPECPGLSRTGESDHVITSVVFDIGETLLDDTREHAAWAGLDRVPRHTFSAVLGAVTAKGRDNAETV
jgi:hypothetical protein